MGAPEGRPDSLGLVSLDLPDDDRVNADFDDSGSTANTDGTNCDRFVGYSSDVKGWIVEVWFRPLPLGSSKPERPVYWKGPPTCEASNLNTSVAVFPDADLARTAFQRCCLPLPRTCTKWSAVSVDEVLTRFSPYPAEHGWSTGRLTPA
jgi:hypothetical protein